MLTTPEPVAKEEGGSDEVATLISVGNVSPTPTPIRIMPSRTPARLGSTPTRIAHRMSPAANSSTPAVTTVAAPKRPMSLPASRSAVVGTNNGPGAIVIPVFIADQPQAVCSHKAIDNSIAPKAAEYGAITKAAPVKG